MNPFGLYQIQYKIYEYPNNFQVRESVENLHITITEIMLKLIQILITKNSGTSWSCDMLQLIPPMVISNFIQKIGDVFYL